MISPFIYGTTVSAHSFTNREAEIQKLTSNLLRGINTMLISPRRWGKSSLVEKVLSEIDGKNKGVKTITLDLFTVSGEEEFLEMFAREVVKASSNKFEEWVSIGRSFFKQLIPKLNVGLDLQRDFSLTFDWEELKKHSEEILNLPETIAQKKGLRFIICLDEFQNLASFEDFAVFEKKLRSLWQRHQRVTYCLYGSKRHMMTEIFNKPSKPFYRFGDIMLLDKIAPEKWVPFIIDGFKGTGKTISEEDAILIPFLMKNHPWYVQQLAHYTWNMTKKKASSTEIYAALAELLNANSPLYQKEIESLSPTQVNLLKAVISGERQLTGTKTMQAYRLGTPRNVSKNKEILLNNDLIHEINGKLELLDPAFERWFKMAFFGENFLS